MLIYYTPDSELPFANIISLAFTILSKKISDV